jgi:hypothetical protein
MVQYSLAIILSCVNDWSPQLDIKPKDMNMTEGVGVIYLKIQPLVAIVKHHLLIEIYKQFI